ncbi:MAG TPA: diguanylate cyclase [Anaerolineales bacterium]|nr:diguanylate cyclase [Anaerolineales bacterium]
MSSEPNEYNALNEAPAQDTLTGAYTRATFKASLHALIEQAQRDNTTCSLMVIDLDHFKSINDAFGHAKGDEVLSGAAHLILQNTRASDLFFRYGGDEFVLLLPNTTKTEAFDLAQRLLGIIRAQSFSRDTVLTLTLSIGVAAFPEDASDGQSLFEKADARNYEAKRRGRACVISRDGGTTSDLSFIKPSRLIERDASLELAQNFLSALVSQQHGVFGVIGPIGVGCSRFLVEVEKRARLQGFEVIALRGNPQLMARPYGVLENILQNPDGTAFTQNNLEKIIKAFQRRLTESGRDRLLISVDDLPQLDWGTLDLLRQILSSNEFPVLGLVYATDPDHARVTAPFRAALSEYVTLSPLTPAGLQVWLRTLLQWDPPNDFIHWLEKHTHGLPAQAEQVLKHMLKEGALTRQDSGWHLSENYATIGAAGMRQWQKRVSPNNLPAALTSFVGRETELKDVRQLLATTRLLTVVGPGGMGKTRLTLQVAKEAINGFRNGVWLVELAPVTDPALALYTIATVLGVEQVQSHSLMETVCTWLSDKEILLILDNCEHLIDMCAQFSHEVLSTSPSVRILASSREALDIAGELVYRMPALETPNIQAEVPAGQLMQYAAARLFAERAAFALSTFRVNAEEAPLIAQICRQLDGIPLAIELAAARLRTLTLEEIATGLNDRFNLLTRGNRAAAPRQQTLRALIDWSYDSLSENERKLFCRLSIFQGSWTQDAIGIICSGDGIESHGVSDLFTQLINKSLIEAIERSTNKEPRFRMLETIRQYAYEKLLETEGSETIRQKHLAYFMGLVERAAPNLRTFDMLIWLDRLEDELDNIRAALEWGLKSDIETVLRLASALLWFWHIHSHQNEATDWLKQGLAREANERGGNPIGPQRALLRGNALNTISFLMRNSEQRITLLEESLSLFRELGVQGRQGLATALRILGNSELEKGHNKQARAFVEEGLSIFMEIREPFDMAECLDLLVSLAMDEGDFERARGLQEEALSLRKEIGDKDGTAYALYILGQIAHRQNKAALAQALYEESLKLFREIDNRTWVADITGTFAVLASAQGNRKKAVHLIEEGLALARDLDDKYGLAHLMLNLGEAMRFQGDLDRASQLYEEALVLSQRMDANNFISSVLYGKAEIARSQNDLEQAYTLHCEALNIRQKISHTYGIVRSLNAIAELTILQGNSPQAVRLFGAIESMYKTSRPPTEQAGHDRVVSAARSQMGETMFNSIWSEGQKLPLDQAISLVLTKRSAT